MTESTESSRKGYSWTTVKPGLARAIYTAMKSRSQHKGEATSTYANVIAEMVEESGIDYAAPPILDDAQKKLDQIVNILGIDPEAIFEVAAMRAENEQLRGSLRSLKELLTEL